MKELDSFTVDRLKDLINQYVHEEYNDVSDEEVIKLVSIALAAKRAEPVGYLEQNHLDYLRSGSDADIWPEGGAGDIPVYLTPQLNSPEIQEGWNGTLETAAKLIDLCRTYTILGNTGSYKERTINDCELTMQEIESYLAAAPEKP
ncbi:hypothetical protein J8Z86_08320 [Yersinia enterocolitica]|uniref:hypothetical protein n=1 Tax=Yersinia enterocolitica TaxID=630 RepID=UPI001C8DB67B|nr:hypothetical protein [Yersinia enterocolitica]MBX9496080.1 hypothetical protein [Yersinia enterocolitica]